MPPGAGGRILQSKARHCTMGRCPLEEAVSKAVKPLSFASSMLDPPSISSHGRSQGSSYNSNKAVNTPLFLAGGGVLADP